jgi:rhamnosyltransferase subunit B
MRLLLPTLGSAGDIHPFLAIGQAMQARGHDVEVLTNPVFADMVAGAGLNMHPVGMQQHYIDTFNSRKLWHPVDGLGVLWRRLARHTIEPVYSRIEQLAMRQPGRRCVVMTTPLMFGARLANEKLGVPLLSAYTSATMLRSCLDPLTIAQWRVPTWLPASLRATAWRALDRFKLEPLVAADIKQARQALGLPALSQSVFGAWMHSPTAGMTLFPNWFAPAQRDWPQQVTQAGFPLYDGDAAVGLDARLAQFLDDGDAPIVFTPGSAMGHGHAFFRAAVGSCAALKRRGVLLTANVAQLPADLPQTIYACSYAPFGLLLRRALAVVHHGGIGTCAQALRAGLPQLVTPMGFDQFDNAMRLELLGVARSLSGRDTHLNLMTEHLDGVIRSPEIASACQQIAFKLKAPSESVTQICDLLESMP